MDLAGSLMDHGLLGACGILQRVEVTHLQLDLDRCSWGGTVLPIRAMVHPPID